MRRVLVIGILLVLFVFKGQTQQTSTISADRLRSIVDTLASPSFEGRGIETAGIRLAERYLIDQFISMGLQPGNGDSYRQSFPAYRRVMSSLKSAQIIFAGDTLNQFSEFFSPYNTFNEYRIKEGLHFGGFSDQPLTENIPENKEAILLLARGAVQKMEEISSSASTAIFVLPTDEFYREFVETNTKGVYKGEFRKDKFFIPTKGLTSYYFSPTMGAKLLGVPEEDLKKWIEKEDIEKIVKEIQFPDSIISLAKNTKALIDPANVLGKIEGESLDSTIVLSAHYDHIGLAGNNQYYAGANDNASGTSAILEMARVLVNQNIKPKYTIIFAVFSAEESGLIGSHHYVEDVKFEVNKVKVNINLDMIGNHDPEHDSIPNFIYGYGLQKQSGWLMQLADSINRVHQFLYLDQFENNSKQGKYFLRLSDQANFVKHNIPVLFFFNGFSPNYHKVRDTPEKLNYQQMKNVCDLVVELVREIAY